MQTCGTCEHYRPFTSKAGVCAAIELNTQELEKDFARAMQPCIVNNSDGGECKKWKKEN